MSQDTQDMADASNGVDINPSVGAPPSTLGSVVGNDTPPSPVLRETGGIDANAPAASSGGSRLFAILSAVAHVGSVGIAGAANQKGRASFAGGLAGGAQAELQDQAQQQDVKFKTFDDQVRAANLHNQDLQLQGRTQEQSDAHQKAQDDQHDWNDAHGIEDTTIPNDGDAVIDHLKTQTAANGAATVPPGTHLSADGQVVHVPTDSASTKAGQLEQYKTFGPTLGLPSLPQGAQFVPPRMLDAMTHKLQGFDIGGNNITADKLPGVISSTQAQRDTLAKNNATPAQLGALDNVLNIYKANLKADNDQQANVASAKKGAEVAAENSPIAIKGAADKAGAIAKAQQPFKEALQDNAASNKPQKADTQMYVGTDATGNQIAGTSTDLASAGAQGVTKLDSDTGKKVITARQLISPSGLFSQISQDMKALQANGKLGSSAEARINDALLQKAGSDPSYAPLFVHTHLLATALMQAHVGSRGSADMMEEFKSLANSGKMNADTLRSALSAEYNYVHEKAMLPKAQPSGGQ
ncbi:MAG TPA: hypothetical protein VNO32_26680 [Candidatus Acidoferrum sp.]|nr:hypothetical protein [Candidatus Acidoferrum sp.]